MAGGFLCDSKPESVPIVTTGGEEEFLNIARAFYLGVPSKLDMIHYNRIASPLLKNEIDRKEVDMYVK